MVVVLAVTMVMGGGEGWKRWLWWASSWLPTVMQTKVWSNNREFLLRCEKKRDYYCSCAEKHGVARWSSIYRYLLERVSLWRFGFDWSHPKPNVAGAALLVGTRSTELYFEVIKWGI